jgi:hypothetical protein
MIWSIVTHGPACAGNIKLEPEVTKIKRRVQVETNLYFEYQVSPHRAILARRSEVEAKDLSGEIISCQASNEFPSQNSDDEAQLDRSKRVAGFHIPFKQVRLKGQINPLKPPLHVETVLIGRALGQQTGYLAGVGFRIRDDGSRPRSIKPERSNSPWRKRSCIDASGL